MASILDVTVAVTLPDGTPYAGKYELQVGDCTGLDDLDIRRETGYTLVGLMQEVQKDEGLALVFACAVAWLVRRRNFPHVTFRDVCGSVPWGSDFLLDLTGEATDEGKADSGRTIPES